MRSLSVRLLLSFLVLLVSPALLAHDVTLTGTQSFASLDGSSNDHDGTVNGVFTVSDGNLTVNGVVNCNDTSGSGSACAMSFNVSGNLTINSGGALYAENRTGAGTGGAITLTVGGDLALNGNAIVSSASGTSSGSTGGAITANVGGDVLLGAGSTIDAGASNAQGGAILIGSAGTVSIAGNILSGPSRTILASRLTGDILSGGTANQIGGSITIASTTFEEPAVAIASSANIVSQGEKNGAGPVTIEGCGVEIRGLVAAIARSDSAARVSVRSGKSILVDGRDLGVTGTRMGRVRVDATADGAVDHGADFFASEDVAILGPSGAGDLFAISANPGGKNKKDGAGTVRVISLGTTVTASGRAIIAGADGKGTRGGTISIAAADDVTLDGATLVAIGDYTKPKKESGGGTISVRSYSGDLSWSPGTGDVRPIGSASGLVPADQGKIVLTACGAINTAGASFPVQGVATGVFPVTQTACSPAAPSLPSGVPPLVTCNTPPVANDVAVTTLEDVAASIILSGTDVDGDPLTFSIVTLPLHGTLGPIVPTGPTTAQVFYSPVFNYNGSDSFVYKTDDGNGGTDTATVTITITPVNDEPIFFAGPTVNVFEDAGPQTYTAWVTGISAGAPDEAGQNVTFSVANNNPALFSVQPAIASNGTLTYTPAPNAYGTATLTIVAHDDGGTANGGDDTSPAQPGTINVLAVNDEPSFLAGANQTVLEDAGPQSVAGWATAISSGPNETQGLTFIVSSSNPSLFSSGPSVAPNGTLTYTPAPNANGTATVSVALKDDGGTANGGDDTSATQTFVISVTAVNDAPSFTSGGNVTVNEDSAAYSAAWATAISVGPPDESSQTFTFSVANDNNALFSVQPSIDASGNLTFTPAANAFGSATVTVTISDNGGTANGGVDTSAPHSFAITLSAVNDEPSFTAGSNVTVSEDSGAYSAPWANAISAGAGETQTLTFFVSNDNNALFASQPSINASGTLTFTPAANAFGTAAVTVYLQDNGGTANGGDDTSASVTFTIDVTPVNDEPSFVSGGNVSVNEDSVSYSSVWATGISAGPANESSQNVTFFVSNSNNALFSAQPSISPAGVLSFTVAANASGSATVSVFVKDDGGTANGGDDTSATQTFTLTVNAVNDAPSFTGGGNVTVNEDSGAYSATWATAISAGPGEGGQTVAFFASNTNNALFSAQPSISASGVLTFTPAPNAFGSATVSVYAQDNGGTANGGIDTSATVTFTITINGVNDPPAAGNDAWETFGNTELRVDLAAGTTPSVNDTTTSGSGVLDNDVDAIEGDPFAITGVVGCPDTTAPFVCAVTGGTVTLNANGTFSFQPSPGAASGSFQYTVTDMPSAGAPASANGTVTITFHEMIWYVNGSAPAGGNGTSASPYNSLAPLNGVADPDDDNDYIFVHNSTVNSNITLEQGQRLWGEGVGLILPYNLNGNGGPTTLVAAGTRPSVSSSGDVVSVPGVSAEVAGLSLNSGIGNAIDVTSAFLSAASTVSIYGNVITGAGAEGIDVNAGSTSGTTILANNNTITSTGNGFDVSGTLGTVAISFTNATVTSGGTGVRIDRTAPATVKVIGFSNVTISGSTAGDGIRVSNAQFDANAGTPAFETVNAGSIAVGSSGDPVGAQGVVLSNVSGDLAFGSLTAHGATNGATIAGSGLFTGSAGMRVTSGTGALRGVAGYGLSITNATIGAANFAVTRIDATGAANGIVLNNTGALGGLVVAGTGSAGSGGTIQNTTSDSILLTNTGGVSLSWMNVQNSSESGILGTTVTGLSLANTSFTNNGNDSGDEGIKVTNLLGTSTWSNVTISGSAHNNVFIDNTSGTLTSLTVNNSTISGNGVAFGANAFLLQARSTATVGTVTINGSTISGAPSSGVMIQAQDTATVTSAVVSGSTITSNGTGVNFTQANAGNLAFKVLNNVSTGSQLHAVNAFSSGASTGGSLTGRIEGNMIGQSASAGSGSAFGNGIRVFVQAQTRGIILIDNNVVRQTPFGRGVEVTGMSVPGLDVTVTNNNVDPQDTSGFPLAAIFVTSDNLGAGGLVRADIRGNVVPAVSNTYDYPTFDGTATNLIFEEQSGAVSQLVDTPPASPNATGQLTSTNTGSAYANPGVALISGPIITPP